MAAEEIEFDRIGYWSEVKLDIVREYAQAYSTILTKKSLSHVYIDGFSGPGVNISKRTGEFVLGSPLNALNVKPGFKEFFFIDLVGDKVEYLRNLIGDRTDVHIFEGDCNSILLEEIFPRVRYEDYRRGLCLLDPYGLHLNWEVIEAAGKLSTIDLFLNFPIMDINRNAMWRNPENVHASGIVRMNAFWGDESWRDIAYRVKAQQSFFGEEEEKLGNYEVTEAFRERLSAKAGFLHVPRPMPMRISTGSVIYYLYFASQRPVAKKIAMDIFNKYRNRGV